MSDSANERPKDVYAPPIRSGTDMTREEVQKYAREAWRSTHPLAGWSDRDGYYDDIGLRWPHQPAPTMTEHIDTQYNGLHDVGPEDIFSWLRKQ